MIKEKMITGFCRTNNQIQRVVCEIEEISGRKDLIFIDCYYEKCKHRGSCPVAQEVEGLIK